MALRFEFALLGFLCLVLPCTAAAEQVQPRTAPGQVVVSTSALDGTVRLAGVDVALHLPDGYVVAQTVTGIDGQVTFPDVAPGRYFVRAARPGFVPTDTPPFEVAAGEVARVSLGLSLNFVAPDVDVTAPAALEVPQYVSTSDVLAGSVLDVAPLQGDDFQSLLPLLPGVVRGPDGRLRAKGGQTAQSALQISSTSLNDPTTGDFDLQLPGQSLETVELLANPFAAEYGRFSTSIVQIRTRPGTNEWEVKPGNLMPRFRKSFTRVRGFEPRFSVRGPLVADRVFLAQDFQLRYVSDPVKSLPDEPAIELRSFDSFTRLDSVLSTRHSLGAMLVMFPRRVEHLSMDTFRPPEATPDFRQRGISVGVQDRFEWFPNVVLESTLASRRFDTDVRADNDASTTPMVYTPETLRGSYFNDQARDVTSVQWVEALTVAADRWRGQHLFKVGVDFQHSAYDGSSLSRPVEVRRLDGSLAERTVFGRRAGQRITATEFSAFLQDRWRVNGRMTLELGLRIDRDDVVEGITASPRGGVSVAVLPEGRAILRAGVGTFRQRTPLNVAAFEQFEPRTVVQFDTAGAPASTVHFVNVQGPGLRTPHAVATNIEWNQRFTRRVLLKANYLQRAGTHEYVLAPDRTRGEFRLSSAGTSNYSEAELTVRYLGGDRRDLTASYVHSRGTADLNSYDQFYGNVRTPIMYDAARGPISSDVPHRLLVRGTFGLPGGWTLAPILEVRSGFPWSPVDELQMFFAGRDQPGRLPVVKTLDFSLARPWRVWRYRFTGGIRIYNAFGSSSHRDVQNNVVSPNFGRFFNPIERSIGFVFGVAR